MVVTAADALPATPKTAAAAARTTTRDRHAVFIAGEGTRSYDTCAPRPRSARLTGGAPVQISSHQYLRSYLGAADSARQPSAPVDVVGVLPLDRPSAPGAVL